jgi:type IV secretion system protein VirB9
MRGLCAATILLLLAADTGQAAITPQPGPGDPRIQRVEYDPQQVVVLGIALNYALTVEFSPDERIENVSVGNGAVWQVTANKSANRLFIKPTQSPVATGMTVVTDTRVYVFELTGASAASPTTPFVVRFSYPAAPQSPGTQEQAAGVVAYKFSGARELRPTTMNDDGQSTTIIWPAAAVIPAVFTVTADGTEVLANGAMREGRFVIDQIATRFIFRANGKTAYATRQVRKARQ